MKVKDTIDLEIFHNLMVGISEHLSATVERTAFTSFVKETHDYGVSLLTPEGYFFTFPRQSGVTTAVGLDAAEAIRFVPDIREGDIVFTNDPYNSGALASHLPDLHMFRPVFMDGEILCYTWGFIHSSDVGGRVAGSIALSSYEVHQEGIRIPPVKLFENDAPNLTLKRILQENVRIPTHVWGDLEAIRAGFHVAEKEILRIARRFGRDRFVRLMYEIVDYSEAKSRRAIDAIPDGTYRFVDYMEDDYVSNVPVRLQLALTVKGSDLHLDYTGTDPQVMAAINIPTLGTRHMWITVPLVHYLLSEDPSTPVNAGLVRPVTVKLPSGTLVNPVFPAAFGARVITGVKILEVTLGALGKAVPDRVPAAGSGQGMIVVLGTPDMASGGQRVNVLQPMIGGSGGRPTRDGFDGSDYTFAFLRNTPVEVIEAENPIVVHEYKFRRDSGGPGKFRGGMGISLKFQSLLPHTRVTARGMERTKFAPWGTQGGWHGMRTSPFVIERGDGSTDLVDKVDILELGVGDSVLIETSGGGGYGNPLDRELELLQRDVDLGFVSRTHAEEHYGAKFEDDSLTLDAIRTSQERDSRRAKSTDGDNYNFGPERLEFERIWPPALHDELLRRLEAYPLLLRGTVKNWVITRALSLQMERVGPEEFEALWTQCQIVFSRARS